MRRGLLWIGFLALSLGNQYNQYVMQLKYRPYGTNGLNMLSFCLQDQSSLSAASFIRCFLCFSLPAFSVRNTISRGNSVSVNNYVGCSVFSTILIKVYVIFVLFLSNYLYQTNKFIFLRFSSIVWVKVVQYNSYWTDLWIYISCIFRPVHFALYFQ